MSEQGDSLEPQSKRQKRGDGDEVAAPEIIAFGGPMYDEATARKMLKEVGFDDDDSDKESNDDDGDNEFQGFDPDDAALDRSYDISGWITPLIYFALKEDVKMCRYLISRDASTTKAAEDNFYFPLLAAVSGGRLEICKLLHENGAENDVRRANSYHLTPFTVASTRGHVKVKRWLVLHGALCADNNSEDVDGRRIEWNIYGVVRSCEELVAWAKEVTQSHSAVVTFLGGTLPPAPDAGQSCTLQCLSGYPGVRKHIFDFVGLEVTKRKHLRILRSVVEVLPAYI